MPIGEKVRNEIQDIVPDLYTEPIFGLLPHPLELSEAEKRFKRFAVRELKYENGEYGVSITMNNSEYAFSPLYVFGNRPYIRVYDRSEHVSLDIFVLPPE